MEVRQKERQPNKYCWLSNSTVSGVLKPRNSEVLNTQLTTTSLLLYFTSNEYDKLYLKGLKTFEALYLTFGFFAKYTHIQISHLKA